MYHNVSQGSVLPEHEPMVKEIEERGLLYPVTVVDGVPIYDGAVSYPAILRAVHNKLVEQQEAPSN